MDPTILIVVAALACPVSMGLLMWMIVRNQGQVQGGVTANSAKPEERLAALQAQREGMNKEIAELEKIKALEARRQALEQSKSEPATSHS